MGLLGDIGGAIGGSIAGPGGYAFGSGDIGMDILTGGAFSNAKSVQETNEKQMELANQQMKFQERMSAAISDRFCVLDGKVFLYDIPIGFITDSKARIHPMFKQEVSDICTRNKLPIKVEVYHEE